MDGDMFSVLIYLKSTKEDFFFLSSQICEGHTKEEQVLPRFRANLCLLSLFSTEGFLDLPL